MKRVKIVLIGLLLLSLITLSLFACRDTNLVDNDSTTEIAPITITATEEGFSFSHSDYTYFFYTLDDGDREETTEEGVIEFSETPGSHVLKVFALDLTGKEVAVARYNYTTVVVSLSDLSVSGKTISWVAKAKQVSIKEKGDFAPVEGNDYTTELDGGTIRVKADGGYDAASKTYYAGASVTKSAKIVSTTLKALSTPTIRVELETLDPEEVQSLSLPSWSIVVKKVLWDAVSHASKYAVSYDGGAFTDATTALLSDEVGKHTVRVKAVGDGETYEDSVPAVYEYETVRATTPVVLKKDFYLADVGFDAPACYYSVDNFEYQLIEKSASSDAVGADEVYRFSAGESTTYYFRAWGFDLKSAKNYAVSEPASVAFYAPASREIVLENADEDGIDSRWTAEKKVADSWVSVENAVGYGSDYDKDRVLKMTARTDGDLYRFSTALDLANIPDRLSFRYCGDGVSQVRLVLSSDEGYALERDLGVMPDYWQEYTYRLDASEWIVGGTDISLRSLWESRSANTTKGGFAAKVAGYASLLEVYALFDAFSFELQCEGGQNGVSAHFADDILFDYEPTAAEVIYQPIIALGTSFVAEEVMESGVNELLFFLGEEGSCKIYSTALEDNFILIGNYTLSEGDATIEITSNSGFSMGLALTHNGKGAVVTAATGQNAEHFLACGAFVATADYSEDYESGESDEPYSAEDWTAYTLALSGESTPLLTPHIHYDVKDASSVLRFSIGKDLTDRFVFNENGRALGLANTVSLSLGNCMEEAAALDLKLIAVDTSGVRYYLKGSESAFQSYAVTDGLAEISVILPKAITFSTLEIVVRNATEKEVAYLYLDDLAVTYKADPSVFSGYPEPVIEAGETLFTFSYTEEDVAFEYSLNDEDWVEATNCAIPSVAGYYRLRVRALIGEDRAPSKVATYSFYVEEVSLSSVSVSIEEAGQRASWQTNGKVSICVDQRTESGVEVGEYQAVEENVYFTDKNVILNVRAEGYFDAENKIYYVGTQEISKKILVDVVLGAPVVAAGQDGLFWDAVEDANAYAVSVNGGDYVTREDRTYPFAINEGLYTVRVMSVLLDEAGEISAYSNYSEYSYRVLNVSLPNLVVDKATVSWNAVAYKTYLKVDVTEFEERPLSDSFKATAPGANQITVKAIAGYDEESRIYYYSAKDVTKNATVTVLKFSAPTLLVKEDKSGLYWAFVNEESHQITTIEDIASTYPEVTYRISLNEGAWTQATEYLFPTAPGEYSVRVMAVGNGENIRDTEPSVPYTFTVKIVTLSEAPEYLQQEEKANGGSEIAFDYVALHAYQKIGVNGTERETVDTTFLTDKTIAYYFRVEGGWDEENHVYYAGAPISREWNVIVPIKLAPPVISHNIEGISWSSVLNANKFRVSINGGEYEEPTSDMSRAFSDIGTYVVRIKSVNTVYPEQYPDSDPAEITYRVVAVALSDLRIDGAVVSWDYAGLNLYLKLGESAEFDRKNPYNKTSYANESGDDAKVYVMVEGGYDYVNIVHYKGSSIQKDLDVVYSELLTPSLKLNTAKDGLDWDEVSKVYDGYRFKSLPAGLTDEGIAAEMASEENWSRTEGRTYPFEQDDADHVILIKAIGNGSTISDSAPAIWRFSSRSVYLRNFAVNKGVATWEKSGFTEIQTYRIVNGSPQNVVPFDAITECTLTPEATLYADLRCKAGYDATNNIYYHGSTVLLSAQEIIVPIYLDTPTVRAETTGIHLTNVTNADAYKVSVNGGEYETIETNRIDYLDAIGSYTVKIRSCHKTQPEQYPESEDVVVTYDVRAVSLSEIMPTNVTTQGGYASFTADGLLSIGTSGSADQPLLPNYTGASYAVDYRVTATATVYVKAEAGVRVLGERQAVRYVGDSELNGEKKIIVPIVLAKPSLNETSTSLSILSVTNADRYLISVDGGAWTPQTATTVAYATALGDHSIAVKAHSTREDGQYLDSEAATVNYRTTALSLSDISVSGATFSWSANAYLVKRQINSGSSSETTDTSYTATASGTTTIKITAYPGYSASTHVYYYGTSNIVKEKSVSITKLDTPSLSVSGKNITWSAISKAKEYAVKVNSGSWSYQSGTTYALSSQAGSYTVTVKAVNRDDATIFDSSEKAFSYTTKTVTLSNISVSGSKATWSATAYKTYLKVGSGSYSETTATSYTPTSEGTFAIKVKAEGGWDNTNKIYYYASAAIEKSASVTLATLAAPKLTTSSKGVTWSAVANASTYSVKIDNGSYKNQTDKSVSFSTTSGTHTVYVKAIAAANSGYQDSAAASYTYETKQTAFSFLTSSATMCTWIYTGLSAQYSTNNGSTYSDTTRTGYTATATGSVKFRAVGGWDAAGNTYYNGTTSAQSKSFTLPGLCIANNFETGVSGWSREVYSSSWATSDKITITSVTDAYGAGSAIKLKTWLNGMAYRFGYQFGDLPASYKSMSFDVKLNDLDATGTSLRFQDSASGTYVDYSLKHLSLTPGVWYHITVGFEDSNLIINSGGSEYTAPKAKKLLGEKSFYEKIKALDKVYITVKGTTSNGATVQTYFDNFQFSTATCGTATKTQIKPFELPFTDNNVDSDSNYTNSKWKQYEYKESGFGATSKKLKIETAEGDKILSLYAGYNTYKITYNEGGSSLGTFNHFAVDLGCESSATVKYRIELVTDGGSIIYVAGGAETMATIASPGGNAALKTLTFNFSATKIKSITIYASAGSGNGHLYLDNLTLSNLS